MKQLLLTIAATLALAGLTRSASALVFTSVSTCKTCSPQPEPVCVYEPSTGRYTCRSPSIVGGPIYKGGQAAKSRNTAH